MLYIYIYYIIYIYIYRERERERKRERGSETEGERSKNTKMHAWKYIKLSHARRIICGGTQPRFHLPGGNPASVPGNDWGKPSPGSIFLGEPSPGSICLGGTRPSLGSGQRLGGTQPRFRATTGGNPAQVPSSWGEPSPGSICLGGTQPRFAQCNRYTYWFKFTEIEPKYLNAILPVTKLDIKCAELVTGTACHELSIIIFCSMRSSWDALLGELGVCSWGVLQEGSPSHPHVGQKPTYQHRRALRKCELWRGSKEEPGTWMAHTARV